ncbi:hypothetical protein [Marinobacter sp. Arc7-DN-1]|uniref:hypothetical protein n=1 Tax=Marinobacter sp. Arc7-DN-1 TaxID=2304594 RepID=UPI001D0D98DE|nr:hypothetical protein [Marinobacter sp. Arc7-DN-1]
MKRDSLSQCIQSAGLLVFLLLAPMTTQASDDLDVTMRMVTDDVELTDSVVREIELPHAVERPDTPAKFGSRGLDAAREARERGREFGESMSEKARQSRDLIKGNAERPERPELPDAAGRER